MPDLSAAFDCVDHGILLDRLETSFGFSEVVLDWMRSYLVGRMQYVRYNGSTSLVTVMQCDVPQGSVLGPLYFVLYTADAFRIVGELGFLSMDMQMICRSMITALPAIRPSSPIDLFTASRASAVGCQATA